MNITNFIKTKLALFFIASAWPIFGYADVHEVTHFKSSEIQLETSCTDKGGGQNCVIYSVAKNWRKSIISFPFAPSNIDYSDGVFVVSFPCGTECSATYFYKSKGALGGPFPLVESYDIERGVVLSVSKNSLQMYKIFSKEKLKSLGSVVLNVQSDEDIVGVIHDVKLGDHMFIVTYVDKNGNLVTTSQAVPIVDKK